MSLFVSMNLPSYEMVKSPIDEAITYIAAHALVENRQGHFPVGPSLDITFMLSSKEDTPPFTGMRMGGYNPEGGTLYFEAAVPEPITRSEHASRYVALVLQDMVDNAKSYFEGLAIDFDISAWRRVLDSVTAPGYGKEMEH